jgi:hypothetical protein
VVLLTESQYIYYKSPAYLDLHKLWTGWPDRELTALMKGYMLSQLGFWLQQLFVINIEERRKDHWQMFTHHIVTSVLIYASYRYGHTRVGNLILVLMDVSDLALGVRFETPNPKPPHLSHPTLAYMFANRRTRLVPHRLPNASNTSATTPSATSCLASS